MLSLFFVVVWCTQPSTDTEFSCTSRRIRWYLPTFSAASKILLVLYFKRKRSSTIALSNFKKKNCPKSLNFKIISTNVREIFEYCWKGFLKTDTFPINKWSVNVRVEKENLENSLRKKIYFLFTRKKFHLAN